MLSMCDRHILSRDPEATLPGLFDGKTFYPEGLKVWVWKSAFV